MERLCKKCVKATDRRTNQSWVLRHHSTYRKLKPSVDDGCELCSLMRHGLLAQYNCQFGDNWEATEQYQLKIDETDVDPQTGKPIAPFILMNNFVEIDPKYSPFESGSIGFWFYRAQDQDKRPWAIDEIDVLIAFETPAGSISQTVGKVIGAPTSEEPNLSVAEKWIRDCRDNHPHHQYSPFTDVTLPTRVLDVRPSPEMDHVRLVITDRSQGRYVTLSHRWGDPNKMPIKLTAGTCENLRNGISVTSLPKTFQDAVAVTRRLGYHYLWIDSLCILQDSSEDWQKAAIEMPDIYNNAELNICGPAAADCTAGFLNRRHIPPESRALEVPWRIIENKNHPRETLRLLYRGNLPNNGEPPHGEPNSALATRGWILQERLLSQRMLYFGSRNMSWECNTNASYETLHFPLSGDSKLRMEVPKLSFNDPTNSDLNAPPLGWRWNWYNCSRRALRRTSPSKPTDSPQYSPWLSDSHGYWEMNILPAYGNPNLSKGCLAPSWSWASTLMALDHLNKHPNAGTWEFIPGETAEIVDIRVTPVSSDNPFSSIVSGSSITLRSRFLRARVFLKPMEIEGFGDHFKGRDRWKAYYHQEEGNDPQEIQLGTFFPDHNLASDMSHEFTFLPIAYVPISNKGSKILRNTPWSAVALAVEEIPGEQGKYRRRGLLFDESLCVYGIKDEAVFLRKLLRDRPGELGIFEIA